MVVFLFWVLFVTLVTLWAKSWNRSGVIYFLVSLILSPIVGAIALLIHGNGNKVCPKCAEKVKNDAEVCKHCGYQFEVEEVPVE